MTVKTFVIGRIGNHSNALSAADIIDKIKTDHVSLLATFRVHYLIEGSMDFKMKMQYTSFLNLAQHGSFHKISITDFEIIYGVAELRKIAEVRELLLYPIITRAESEAIEQALSGHDEEMEAFRLTRFKLHCLAKHALEEYENNLPSDA